MYVLQTGKNPLSTINWGVVRIGAGLSTCVFELSKGYVHADSGKCSSCIIGMALRTFLKYRQRKCGLGHAVCDGDLSQLDEFVIGRRSYSPARCVGVTRAWSIESGWGIWLDQPGRLDVKMRARKNSNRSKAWQLLFPTHSPTHPLTICLGTTPSTPASLASLV